MNSLWCGFESRQQHKQCNFGVVVLEIEEQSIVKERESFYSRFREHKV
jgi:hypothetical protein